LVSSGGFDIVHAHMFDAELAAVLAKPTIDAPIVATRHFAAPRGSTAPARLVGRLLTRFVSRQLAISQFVATTVEGESVVVEPGVANVADPQSIVSRRQEVLILQRLEPEKRTEIGLSAFAESGLAEEGWRLVIAGDGGEAARLRELAQRLGIGRHCDFVGSVADVDGLYRRAAIFLATRPDEPYGLSVVEAMAHGVPVVAASGGGHLETVGRCEDARLFESGNALSAAKMIAELAHDATARGRYGSRLREIQQQNFTVRRQAESTLATYRAIRGGPVGER
jgi:glycosyltransferase involved in cell wall biosynthesis